MSNLNFIQESESYYNLIKDHGFTQQELGEYLGKSQPAIANKLRVFKLSDYIKKELISNSLTERHARELLRISDEAIRLCVLGDIIKHGYTVKKTEETIDVIIEELAIQKEEEHKSKQKIKNSINFKIYLNTLKNAYMAIRDNGVEAFYREKDMGQFIEVTVRIPKK